MIAYVACMIPIAMKKIILSSFLIFSSICFAQHPGPGDCALKPDNKQWILNFKDASDLASKLDLLKMKLSQDASYFEEHPPLENLNDRSVFGSIPCNEKCTLRFVLMYGNRKALSIDLHDQPALQNIVDSFSAEAIDRIEINEKRDRNIYDHTNKTRTGIILYTQDKSLIKTIKQTLKEIKKAES